MIIKSSTNLSNGYSELSTLAHESCEPIYITNNGEGDLVIMSIEAFQQREELFRLRARLDATDQIRVSGAPAYSLNQVFDEIEAIYRGEDI